MHFQEAKIEYISISKLILNNINPNRMPKSTYSELKNSLKKYGQLVPLLVRPKNRKYEIVDGEHRYWAAKEIGISELLCRIVEISDKEMREYIFTSAIKGKHDASKSQELLSKIVEEGDTETLKACGYDKSRLERKMKYHGLKNAKVAKKQAKKRNEKDCSNVYSIDKYKNLLVIPLKMDEYKRVVEKLKKYDKNISKAILKLIKEN